MLVQLLRKKQEERGYLTDADLTEVARQGDVPLYRVEELISFFAHFRRQPPPRLHVQVCRDLSCHLRGAPVLLDKLKSELEAQLKSEIDAVAKAEKITPAGAAAKSLCVEGVSCLGRCDRAPAIVVTRHGEQPTGERVYAGGAGGPAGTRLLGIVKRIAEGGEVPADHDEPHPAAPGWERWNINVYGRRPELPPYAAVKKFVEECERVEREAKEQEKLRRAEELEASKRPTTASGVEPRPKSASQFSRGEEPAALAGAEPTRSREFVRPALVAKAWLARLKRSFLLGMGGAGEPAGKKWGDIYESAEPIKYIVANADESEPATFKDRELMLRCPDLVVEGVILAGLMTNATAGYIYIRHEYEEAIHKVEAAIRRAVAERACGTNILGTNRSFPVEVYVSPGGYICGEQSALIEAMEDKRAQPRNKPPELSANGLHNQPTLVNNVETLAWAPAIFLEAPDWYRSQNSAARPLGKGWRLFSISGDVERPGVFELPVGAPMSDLLAAAGGIRGGKGLGAMATSGPSGGFLPGLLPLKREGAAGRVKAMADGLRKEAEKNPSRDPDMGDRIERFASEHLSTGDAPVVPLAAVPLDLNFFRNLRKILGLPRDAMLGAGLVAYAAGTDVLRQAVNATEFFRNESCGKCVPCRIGSEKMVEVGDGLLKRSRGESVPVMPDEEINLLNDTLEITSICGLGPSVGKPLTSWMVYFRPPNESAQQKERQP